MSGYDNMELGGFDQPSHSCTEEEPQQLKMIPTKNSMTEAWCPEKILINSQNSLESIRNFDRRDTDSTKGVKDGSIQNSSKILSIFHPSNEIVKLNRPGRWTGKEDMKLFKILRDLQKAGVLTLKEIQK
mmetsp:Transcript_19637/g.17364  ORF Transcript_19637/g.17364 Transcript_19637/m.17364 type:complete len:129 (+) Transcript_19637:110-496(+)